MDRLAKVTDEILRSAKEKAQQIKDESDKETAELMSKTAAECAGLEAEYKQKLDSAVEHIGMISESDMRRYKRTELLKIKSEMVASAIASAKKKIENLPEKEYFDLMTSIADKYCGGASGEVRLNKKDSERVPQSFKKYCKDHGMTISNKTADISAGFELHSGKIITDCSIDGLFADEYGRLSDAAKRAFE